MPEGLPPPREAEQHISTFRAIAEDFGQFTGRTRMFRDAELHVATGEDATERRIFPMRQVDSRKLKFVFNEQSFGQFADVFGYHFGDIAKREGTTARQVASELYIGCGIADTIVKYDLQDAVMDEKRLRAIRSFFANKDDIEELFIELFPPGPDFPHDVLWRQSEHVTDRKAMEINGLRVGLRYMFNVRSEVGGVPYDSIVERSRTILQDTFLHNREIYLQIAERRHDRDHRVGEAAFIDGIPEWLFAFAKPMRPEAFSHLTQPSWRR